MFPHKETVADVRSHLMLRSSPEQQRWAVPSLTRDPDIVVSIIASLDTGTHASGWWRNSEYDSCWHMSLCALEPGVRFVDLPDIDLRQWSRAVFGEHVSKSWTEPPASKTDAYRDAPASAYTTHVRVFLNRQGIPIQPTGEVYDLRPWDDGTSPAKVFR